ncbi:CDP-alcohol phosphatidyltransferase family protein [Flavobacterium branchiophilum]|uniref:CDP-diacylglycerol--serine O-phosphatidyltransferase n=1 Tax=Flavobacterium branchiophilum (strain FL-15) TaxID=1034807 RepID=G2Z217_FLABF|nr:CDP-alcohol phosphatidyltransferase family protein [Flavobacterium branchiophilum]CCB69961.1 CDP-diacylglycerol--serine O-phosphatidyltransferase [Flavobacterium branchiophilum FL-15]
MNFKKHIPNSITLLNLFCGCLAIVFVANKQFDLGFYMICLGIFFDFFDGYFARMFNVSGPLGLQLDSLADMVTSGVSPGFMMFFFIKNSISDPFLMIFLPYFGFIITLGACFRLAKFNIDTRQSDSFIGLPTPANTLFIMSLPFVINHYQDAIWLNYLFNTWTLIGISIVSAYIMNAEIPLFSLKIKNFSLKKYKLQIIFVCIALILFIVLLEIAVPLIILLYVLLSIFDNAFNFSK